MNIKRVILVLVSVFCAVCSSAQRTGEYVQPRLLILLDGSSSMTQTWAGGRDKFRAARELIDKLMDSVYNVNNQVQFGLRVFGHQHAVEEKNCYDTRNEVSFSTDNKVQMHLRLEDIHPLGITPIAFSLKEAAINDIIDEDRNAYSIVLITDGGESCGGDICDVIKTLFKNKVYFKPYIVSLENDPALKATYACMGDYIQALNEADIRKAVGIIVEAFRPSLKISKAEYEEIQAKVPSVLKVNVPGKKRQPGDRIPIADVAEQRSFRIPAPVAGKAKEVAMPKFSIKVLPPEAVKVAMLNTAALRPIKINPPVAAKIVAAVKPSNPLPVKVELPPPTEKIAKLALVRLRSFNVIFVIEDRNYPLKRVPPLPPLKLDPVLTTPTPPAAGKHEFKTEVVDNSETTLEVFFTNGAGKFYVTTPQVLLLDPATKKMVKRFYRTVDGNGNPDPQQGIPPGVYDLTFANKPDFVLSGITIEHNKKNKILVTVKNTTVSFGYREPPLGAIKEDWVATVIERNKANGRVQNQNMTEKIKYEPGNYHIEINTFPREIRNVDLDFDAETVITIQHPGYAKFVGNGSISEVVLYQRLGDKFLAFHNLKLSEPRSQHLPIQPGEYQAHYQSGPGMRTAAEKVIVFKIRPNEETVIELK